MLNHVLMYIAEILAGRAMEIEWAGVNINYLYMVRVLGIRIL